MGVALLEEGEILQHQVINLKKHRPRRALITATYKVLDRLYSYYAFDVLVLEKIPNPQPATFALLVAQVRAIRRWTKRRGMPFDEIAAQSVRKHLVHNGRATKRETAKAVVYRYPELRPMLTQDYKYKELYWQNMFDAIALGLTFYDWLRPKRRRGA